MTAPTIFNFADNTVRVIEGSEGEPWFVAADVCRCLGLPQRNGVHQHTKSLLDDEKTRTHIPGNQRGNPNKTVVSESGLYKLVMRSNKPEAREFQNWVTREVLPAIRKDGGYIKGEEQLRSGEMDDEQFLARAVQVAYKKIEEKDQHIETINRTGKPDFMTVRDYLSHQRRVFPKRTLAQFGMKLSKAYKEQHGERPPREEREDGELGSRRFPTAFLDQHMPELLEAA